MVYKIYEVTTAGLVFAFPYEGKYAGAVTAVKEKGKVDTSYKIMNEVGAVRVQSSKSVTNDGTEQVVLKDPDAESGA
jgi:hypothetical protein